MTYTIPRLFPTSPSSRPTASHRPRLSIPSKIRNHLHDTLDIKHPINSHSPQDPLRRLNCFILFPRTVALDNPKTDNLRQQADRERARRIQD